MGLYSWCIQTIFIRKKEAKEVYIMQVGVETFISQKTGKPYNESRGMS